MMRGRCGTLAVTVPMPTKTGEAPALTARKKHCVRDETYVRQVLECVRVSQDLMTNYVQYESQNKDIGKSC